MTETTPIRDGSRDFDFFVGKWIGHNRRLRERLVGSTEWEEFDGISDVRNILGGTANFDEVVFKRAAGDIYGTTLRLYDQKSGEWSIFWAATGSGILDIPMIGSFDKQNGTGKFYAHEVYNGRHVYSRFLWSNISANSVQWEQAFSVDGGTTWETNWLTVFTRI